MLSNNEVSNAVVNLSERVRWARQRRGLTMDQLSALSGINKSTLSRIENNLIAPSTENLIRLTHALQVTFEALIGLTVQDDCREIVESSSNNSDGSSLKLETLRAFVFRRLNQVSRPDLTASRLNVTRRENVPNIATRKSYEEYLIALAGSVKIQYITGLVQDLSEGQIAVILSNHPSFKLKLASESPAVLLKISVPRSTDKLKTGGRNRNTEPYRASSRGLLE